MRWLRRLRNKRAEAEAAEDVRAAEDALEDLQRDLAQAHERTSEIREISRTLRTLDRRNHFAPLVRDALGGKFR